MIEEILHRSVKNYLHQTYSVEDPNIQFQRTRKEFEGDITLVLFSLSGLFDKSMQEFGQNIGEYLQNNLEEVSSFNLVNGFLNINISSLFWLESFLNAYSSDNFGIIFPSNDDPCVLVEYSSPNTNKPIHLGHLRNNFLGYSLSEIIKASGKNVKKVQIINDRGIHICKSMLAWQRFGNGETPDSSGMKGDHLVGKYYVRFDQEYKKEIADLVDSGIPEEQASKQAPIFLQAKEMLLRWEDNDKEVRELWKMMNNWVYSGFDVTYKRLGVDFDKNYYESDTFLLGKNIIDLGIRKEVFYRKDDGSVWVDLSEEGLDEKLLLRSDGTAVYMTQDIGTAIKRYKDFEFSNMIYTVANEQDYHFKVLFLILSKLGYDWAKDCHHLSYGMVDLPSGKMKSREGTVIDADDFIDEMIDTAKDIAQDLGKLDNLDKKEIDELYDIVGLGALKYFLLKVDPKKNMLFDPIESIDFNGNTGPFIQYTYARIQSLLRKSNMSQDKFKSNNYKNIDLDLEAKKIIQHILLFPGVIQEAAKVYNPAIIANYTYNLVKDYNSYYQNFPILNIDDEDLKLFRLSLSDMTGRIISESMNLLEIKVPDQM